MKCSELTLTIMLGGMLALGVMQIGCAATPEVAKAAASGAVVPVRQAPAQGEEPAPVELDRLVAPVALYPDALAAQVLAASTYPVEVVEADRWMHEHSGLDEPARARAVNLQSWDPSVKALTEVPAVLAMMDTNLTWTSALGEAYLGEPQRVLDAVQVMRRRAQLAGNLQSTPEETVSDEEQEILIEPADPQVVYVPEYDPWIVYGAPLVTYPGWVEMPGLFTDGYGIDFGLGIPIGYFGVFPWAWSDWGADWRGHRLRFHQHPYASSGSAFINHRHVGLGRPAVRHFGFAAGLAPADLNHGVFGAAGRYGGGLPPGRAYAGGSRPGSFYGTGSPAAHFPGAGVRPGGFHGGGFHGGGFHGGGPRR
jgi:Protein of unknown function (DUF3300)